MEGKKVVEMKKYDKLRTMRPPKRRFRRSSVAAAVLGVGFVAVVLYLASPLSRLSVVFFNDLSFVSRAGLVELAGLEGQPRFWSLDLREVEDRLARHPLVERASASRSGINSLAITITEIDVVGCAQVEGSHLYLLGDGQALDPEAGISLTCSGVLIHGMTARGVEEGVLATFIRNLSQADPVFGALVQEINYEPAFGDINRFSISLKDGNLVKVNSHTLIESVQNYQTMAEEVDRRGQRGVFTLDPTGGIFQPFEEERSAE